MITIERTDTITIVDEDYEVVWTQEAEIFREMDGADSDGNRGVWRTMVDDAIVESIHSVTPEPDQRTWKLIIDAISDLNSDDDATLKAYADSEGIPLWKILEEGA